MILLPVRNSRCMSGAKRPEVRERQERSLHTTARIGYMSRENFFIQKTIRENSGFVKQKLPQIIQETGRKIFSLQNPVRIKNIPLKF